MIELLLIKLKGNQFIKPKYVCKNRTFCRINNSDSSFFMVNLLYSRLFLKKSWKIAIFVVNMCVKISKHCIHQQYGFPPLGHIAR